jgi:hypothetical protein
LTNPALAAECLSIDSFEFDDMCDSVLGWGWTGGACAEISGCDTTDLNGHDLSPYLYVDEATCAGSCKALECFVVDPSDYGMCTMIVGVAWTGATCESVSGCGTLDGTGVDRSRWFYSDMDKCEEGCAECRDLSAVDFGTCDMWLGYGASGGECAGFSGCDSIDTSAVDQSAWLFSTEEECGERCNECAVVDVEGFGNCKMLMGWAWTGSTCESISGCGATDGDGVDWSYELHSDYTTCLKSCHPTTRLYPPTPGGSGMKNTVRIGGVPTGDTVRLYKSTRVGEKALSSCPGAVLNLKNPDKLGEGVANGKGNVKFKRKVPASMSNKRLYLQAVNMDTCEVSNLVAHDFY